MSYEDRILMELEAEEELQTNSDPSFDEEPELVVEPKVHQTLFN